MVILTSEVTPAVCGAQVLEVVPLVMRFIRAEMRKQGQPLLSVPQLRILAFLNNFPGSSLSSVAEFLGVTKATASTTVDKLVKRGLVARSDHPQERRRHVLTLTNAGVQLFEQVRAATRESLAKVLANLPQNQLAEISQGIALLGDAFKQVNI